MLQKITILHFSLNIYRLYFMLIRLIIQQPPSIWQNGEDHLEIVDALSHNFRLNASTSDLDVFLSNWLFNCRYIITILQLKKKTIYLLSGPRKSHVLPSWLSSAAELTRYALLYAYWASSMKIDLCLLFKQWDIHLNVSNCSVMVFPLFQTHLPSLFILLYIQYVCKFGFMWINLLKKM